MKIFQLTPLLVALGTSTSLAAPQNVLKFGNTAKTVESSTSCRPSKWGNALENSCMCCVVKNAPRSAIDHSIASDILKGCQKYCGSGKAGTRPIDTIADNLNVARTNAKGIVEGILQENSGLHFIDLSSVQSESIAPNGNLTEKGVAHLLYKAYLVPNYTDYTIKLLDGGGANTLQLFLIKEQGQLKYILKGLKKAFEEVQNLEIIRKSPLASLIMDIGKDPEMGVPVLAMDEQNLTYLDQKGAEHHVSVINAATGMALSDLIFDWTKQGKGGITSFKVMKGLYRMGHNIAFIHKKFMDPRSGKTYVHGDMHPYNVFFDDVNDRIVFIDNESFAISIKAPRDISIDIMKFFGRLVATNFKERHAYRQNGISEKEFYDVVIKPFVIGYIDGYGGKDVPANKANRQAIFKRLYETMTNQGALKTYFDNVKTDLNPIELYKSQQTYAKPMFTEIAKEKGFDMGSSSGKPSLLGRMLNR